jgi:hypothetical protein
VRKGYARGHSDARASIFKTMLAILCLLAGVNVSAPVRAAAQTPALTGAGVDAGSQQRLFIGCTLGWILVLSWRLFRLTVRKPTLGPAAG